MPQFFLDLLAGFHQARVLCVGDVMVDFFVYGKADRLSPEAPVPVFHQHHVMESLGGAGNVARNMASLGGRVHFVGVRGDDVSGAAVERLFADLQGATCSFVMDPHRPTTTKTRYLCQNQQLLRVDQELVSPIDADLENRLKGDVLQILPQMTVVVLSDYGKGVLTPSLLRAIIGAANRLSIPVIVDPKGTDYSIYRGAFLLTPNLKELKDGARMPVDTDDDVVAAAQFLQKTYDIQNVLATRSEKGMTLVTAHGTVTHIPADALDVYDVSGAGDTVVATLAAAIGAGASLADGAFLANRAASIVVGKVGTAVVSPSDIEESVHRRTSSETHDKIQDLKQLEQTVIAWRRKGYRIGFTNGCFDLLHPGHVEQLQKARLLCDRLILGLNSDESVRRLKGPTRPVQSSQNRAVVLSALECVDGVVVFDGDTPLSLILALKPDVLIKGADYTVADMVGSKEVLSWGGSVQTVPTVMGHSTSRIIEKILSD